jgi:hypothetical protein
MNSCLRIPGCVVLALLGIPGYTAQGDPSPASAPSADARPSIVTAPPADSVGRLFYSPAQRARLDTRRAEALANANRPLAAPVAAAPRALPPQVVTLNGVVRRNDGTTTVWVNGRPVNDRFHEADITAGSIARESVALDFASSRRRVRLKVGQSVEATSGVVEEGYRRRRTLHSAVVPAGESPAPPPTPASADEPPASTPPAVTARRRRAQDTRDEDLR